MVGRHHFESGAITGGLYCTMIQAPLIEVPALIFVVMFFSLVPDIDCPGSMVTESLPLIGKPISWFIRRLSHAVYVATKGPRDEDWEGTHRHLSHTIVFALFIGAGFGAALSPLVGQHWAIVFGGAAALGCWTHCLGDSLTIMGCPWLWPIPIAGETWYEIGTPRFLRFHTGSTTETAVAWLVIYPAAVLAFPGAFPIFMDLALQIWHGFNGARVTALAA